MLAELLNQIPPDQDIGSVTADGVYVTRRCHDAIAEAECPCCHSASQECYAMEALTQRGYRPETIRDGVKIPGPYSVAVVEWIPPLKTCRDQGASCETDGPEPYGARRRPAGCGDPNPHRCTKPLHSSWPTRHRAHRISPSGGKGTPLIRFVQQSPSAVIWALSLKPHNNILKTVVNKNIAKNKPLCLSVY